MFELTPADWWLLIAVAAAQVVAAGALRTMPLPKVRRRAGGIRPFVRRVVRGSDSHVIWAIEATGRRLGRVSTCLVRALVAELLLDSGDGSISLTIGVRRTGGVFEAHAWLARNGEVLIGAPADEYAPLVNWIGPPA